MLICRTRGITDSNLAEQLEQHVHSGIISLSLHGNKITAKGMPALCAFLTGGRCWALTHLALGDVVSRIGCRIGDEGAILLAHAIHDLPCLTHLSLEHCGIGDGGMIALAEAIRSPGCNVRVMLVSCNEFGDRGRDALCLTAQTKQLSVDAGFSESQQHMIDAMKIKRRMDFMLYFLDFFISWLQFLSFVFTLDLVWTRQNAFDSWLEVLTVFQFDGAASFVTWFVIVIIITVLYDLMLFPTTCGQPMLLLFFLSKARKWPAVIAIMSIFCSLIAMPLFVPVLKILWSVST